MHYSKFPYMSEEDFINPFTSIGFIIGFTVAALVVLYLLRLLLFPSIEKKPRRVRNAFRLLVFSLVTMYIGVLTMRASHSYVRKSHPELLSKLKPEDYESTWNKIMGLRPLLKKEKDQGRRNVQRRSRNGYVDMSRINTAKAGMFRARLLMIAGAILFVVSVILNIVFRAGDYEYEEVIETDEAEQ